MTKLVRMPSAIASPIHTVRGNATVCIPKNAIGKTGADKFDKTNIASPPPTTHNSTIRFTGMISDLHVWIERLPLTYRFLSISFPISLISLIHSI